MIPRDHPPADIAIAVAAAALVMAGSAGLLRVSPSKQRATMTELDIGAGAPVKVVPVLDTDAPLLELGGVPGKPGKQDLPARLMGKKPGPAALPEALPAPPRALAAPPQAGVSPAEAAGPGDPGGVPGGTETDPLKARAADVYGSRIIAWFSSRFRVRGSNLSQSQLAALQAPATVQLSADRRVLGYTLAPSGNAVFDAAARAVLESTRGEQIPPPPENYPEMAPAQIALTFVCKEGRCD
jgi:hypothetical protein